MSRRIAITGASGFIGRHLVAAVLRRGWRPVVLLRRHPGELLRAGVDLDVVIGDLSERGTLERLMRGADTIVHLAGAVKARSKAEFFDINAGGTERLLSVAATANPEASVIHVSSLAAREPTLSPYAASKRAAEEKIAGTAGQRRWIIVRPPAVYGPGDLALLPFFRAARIGVLPVVGSANARFSLIHVADLAEAIAMLIEQGWTGTPLLEIDDLCPGGHDWKEVATALTPLVGKRLATLAVPRGFMRPLAAMAQAIAGITDSPAILSPSKVNELYHDDWVAGIASGLLPRNWRPTYGIHEGFADTWNWYRSRGLLGKRRMGSTR